jgi:hypothetical protein
MKTALLIASILVNVLLVTVYTRRHSSQHIVTETVPVILVEHPAAPPAIAVTNVGVAGLSTNEPAKPVIQNWAGVADTNYFQYKSNLLAIGVPVTSIKNIMEAELDLLYYRKQRALMDPYQSRFWDIVSATNELPNKAASEALRSERSDLLAKLSLSTPAKNQQPYLGVYSEVASDANKAKLLEIEKDYTARMGEVSTKLAVLRVKNPTPEQKAEQTSLNTQMAALNKEKDTQFKAVLSPEERQEYELRTSNFAQRMGAFPDFNATADELKKMSQLSVDARKQAMELADSQPGVPPKDKAALLQSQTDAAFEAAMKAQFGQDRFDQYKLASDRDYQNFSQWTTAAQLPPGTARQLFDEKRQALATAAQIRSSNIPPDQKEAALREVRSALQAQVQTHIKGDNYSAFQKANKNWLNSLE